jgi:histone H3/H4
MSVSTAMAAVGPPPTRKKRSDRYIVISTKRTFSNAFTLNGLRGRVYKPHRQPPRRTPVNGPENTATRRQCRMNERARRLRPGSKSQAFTIWLTAPAKALREIRYYQSSAMAETSLLPFTAFARLVREIANEARNVKDEHHWEKHALVCLQLFTEHVMVMVFEMTYYSL